MKILPSYMSDHSPVHITVNPNLNCDRGRYSWKFNDSLLKDVKFVTDIRTHFETVQKNLQEFSNPHLKWEFFKYEARKFSIAFSKMKKNGRKWAKGLSRGSCSSVCFNRKSTNWGWIFQQKTYLESYYEKKTQGATLRSITVFSWREQKIIKVLPKFGKERRK